MVFDADSSNERTKPKANN